MLWCHRGSAWTWLGAQEESSLDLRFQLIQELIPHLHTPVGGPELSKVPYFQSWDRSEYSFACCGCWQDFCLPSLILLPSRYIQLHFFRQTSPILQSGMYHKQWTIILLVTTLVLPRWSFHDPGWLGVNKTPLFYLYLSIVFSIWVTYTQKRSKNCYRKTVTDLRKLITARISWDHTIISTRQQLLVGVLLLFTPDTNTDKEVPDVRTQTV